MALAIEAVFRVSQKFVVVVEFNGARQKVMAFGDRDGVGAVAPALLGYKFVDGSHESSISSGKLQLVRMGTMAKSKVSLEDVVLYKAKKLATEMRDRAKKEVDKMKKAIEKEPDEIEQQKLIRRMIAYIEDVESKADRIVNLASPKTKKTTK